MTGKPEWATMMETARGLRVAALTMEDLASRFRCQNTDSGGAQCTADDTPGHQCRIDLEDMPS